MTLWLARLTKPVPVPLAGDVLLLVPRLVCGFMLTVYFGAPKFGLPWSPPENGLGFFEVAFWFPNDVAEFGGLFAQFPNTLAWLGAFAEGVGGVCILLGLLARPFAFLIMCTMLVAIFFQQWQAGYWNMLPATGFVWFSLFTMVLGAGRFSLDALISRERAS
ncbi:DoxX family protein [Gemmatimonas phototrophica]|uniref:DoxX family protein n=1 Tax=Gemmatimonas phototrophica TaxID=1379270 RepID=A0A143BGQ1_9BACT|nr:DoxX family protein [Gemmatimonas phototrophica]AMW03791.1 DoxX family protein [Gemmatimonas phototrophica]